jgi:hypothetical protein
MLCLAPINRTSIKKYLYIHGLPRTSPQLPLQSDLLLPIPQPCSNQSQIPELSHFFVIGLLASLSCKDCNQLLGFCNWLTCYKWIFTYDSLELYIHIIYIYIWNSSFEATHTTHVRSLRGSIPKWFFTPKRRRCFDKRSIPWSGVPVRIAPPWPCSCGWPSIRAVCKTPWVEHGKGAGCAEKKHMVIGCLEKWCIYTYICISIVMYSIYICISIVYIYIYHLYV